MTENDAREKLLPCPFCGAKAAMEDGRNDRPWVVECPNRECRAQPFMDHADTRKQAITAWNTRATAQPEPTADAPGEARQRLLALAECRDLSAVYGSEWCSDRAEQFSKDIRAALRPQSPDAVALLRDIVDEVRDPDGAGTLPTDLTTRIDQFLQSEGA